MEKGEEFVPLLFSDGDDDDSILPKKRESERMMLQKQEPELQIIWSINVYIYLLKLEMGKKLLQQQPSETQTIIQIIIQRMNEEDNDIHTTSI